MYILYHVEYLGITLIYIYTVGYRDSIVSTLILMKETHIKIKILQMLWFYLDKIENGGDLIAINLVKLRVLFFVWLKSRQGEEQLRSQFLQISTFNQFLQSHSLTMPLLPSFHKLIFPTTLQSKQLVTEISLLSVFVSVFN